MVKTSIVVFAFIIAACVHLPYVAPKTRSNAQQRGAEVVFRTACVQSDPFASGDPGSTRSPNPDMDYGSGTATGVVIDERHILTAYHSVRCPLIPRVGVTLSDGRYFSAVVISEDADRDLATLESASAENFNLGIAPPIRGPRPAVGDEVCTARQCGLVTGFNTEAIYGKRGDVKHSINLRPGDSGSGLYDASGRLIGVNTMALVCTEGTKTVPCGGQATVLDTP